MRVAALVQSHRRVLWNMEQRSARTDVTRRVVRTPDRHDKSLMHMTSEGSCFPRSLTKGRDLLRAAEAFIPN
jgi:hypothetical protein